MDPKNKANNEEDLGELINLVCKDCEDEIKEKEKAFQHYEELLTSKNEEDRAEAELMELAFENELREAEYDSRFEFNHY